VSHAFIVDGVRTAIGNIGGSLSDVRADDLGARVISALMARNSGVDPAAIEDLIFGCANQAGEDNRNVARMSALLAGLPVTVPGETVNRLCASGMSAVANAARAVKDGDGEFYIAGGVESMTRAPYVMSKGSKPFARDLEFFDTSLGWRFVNPAMKAKYGTDSMGQTAENVAEQFGITRDDQDRFALRSQQNAARARTMGRFTSEIVAVDIAQKKGEPTRVDQDEFIRADTTMEGLIASKGAVKDFDLTPRARVIATAVAGVEPRIMGMGPVPATQKVLHRALLKLEQMDVIELNEAFAAQSLACLRELGLKDDDARVNINGGAIALGHPLGMSGARLVLTAMRELEQSSKRYALCTMCIGVGQGMAIIIERV